MVSGLSDCVSINLFIIIPDTNNELELRTPQYGLTLNKYRVTTDSKHHFSVSPNLLEQHFTALAPDRVWVPDITYLTTGTGWLYLTVIIDVFSPVVVGWALSS
jgi:transposase InsO family protein